MVNFNFSKEIYNSAPAIGLVLAGLFVVTQAQSIITKNAYKALRRRPFPNYPISPFTAPGYGYYNNTTQAELLNQVDWGGNEY